MTAGLIFIIDQKPLLISARARKRESWSIRFSCPAALLIPDQKNDKFMAPLLYASIIALIFRLHR